MRVLVALLTSLLMGTIAFAADLTIFGGDGSPPKMYRKDDANRGILVDILEYANRRMPKDQLQVELYPWARAYQQALTGRGGVVGLSWTHRRDDLFDYSIPLFFDEVVVVVRKGHAFAFKTLDDLKGKRVGMVRGASYGEEFDQALEANLFIVDGDSGAQSRLNKLVQGRIDCGLFNVGRVGFEEAMRVNKLFASFKDLLVVLPVPLRRDPNYLAFPKEMHMSKWLVHFNEIVKNGYAQGDIQKIVVQNLYQ